MYFHKSTDDTQQHQKLGDNLSTVKYYNMSVLSDAKLMSLLTAH